MMLDVFGANGYHRVPTNETTGVGFRVTYVPNPKQWGYWRWADWPYYVAEDASLNSGNIHDALATIGRTRRSFLRQPIPFPVSERPQSVISCRRQNQSSLIVANRTLTDRKFDSA